jgi:hypothetical protein
VKDRDALLTFKDFPAEHWAICEWRTRTRGALSQDTARLVVFNRIHGRGKPGAG